MEALLDIEGYVIKIERLGLRVVNIFDGPIAESIIFNVTSSPLPLAESQFHSTFVYQEGEFKNTLQIGNNVDIVNEGKAAKASILDIDTFKEDATGDILQNLWDLIDRAHSIEKRTFFSLLRPEKLERLNPVY